MSDEVFDLWAKGLEIAEYNTLREKSKRNEQVVQMDDDGKIILVPARELFTKLYNEPAPTY